MAVLVSRRHACCPGNSYTTSVDATPVGGLGAWPGRVPVAAPLLGLPIEVAQQDRAGAHPVSAPLWTVGETGAVRDEPGAPHPGLP